MYTDEKIVKLKRQVELLEKVLKLAVTPNKNTALREMLYLHNLQ